MHNKTNNKPETVPTFEIHLITWIKKTAIPLFTWHQQGSREQNIVFTRVNRPALEANVQVFCCIHYSLPWGQSKSALPLENSRHNWLLDMPRLNQQEDTQKKTWKLTLRWRSQHKTSNQWHHTCFYCDKLTRSILPSNMLYFNNICPCFKKK